MTTINWNTILEQAKSAAFEVLPKGEYPIRIEEPEAVTASTGKPMIKFRARVTAGPHARASIRGQQVLTIDNPQAVAIFVRFLKTFGVDEAYLSQLGTTADLTPIAMILEGREATAIVDTREWQGEQQNEIKRFKAIAPGSTVAAPQTGMPVPVPGMSPVPGGQVIPMPGVQVPGAPAYGTPPTPPAPAPSVVQDAPPAQPAPPAPQPPAPAPAPVAAPVASPPPAPAPQVAPQPAPQSAPVAPVTAPTAAPAAPAVNGAFDFASLPPEVQQQLMAQIMASQAQAATPAAPAAQETPATSTAPTVSAPPLPY